MQNVKNLKIWLSRVVGDFKAEYFCKKFEFGWEMANPHDWKCNSISYEKPSNLINLLFFIDGKYSMVDTRHAYEVNEKRKNSIWTWNEGETNSQTCTSNGHLHKIEETKPLR